MKIVKYGEELPQLKGRGEREETNNIRVVHTTGIDITLIDESDDIYPHFYIDKTGTIYELGEVNAKLGKNDDTVEVWIDGDKGNMAQDIAKKDLVKWLDEVIYYKIPLELIGI